MKIFITTWIVVLAAMIAMDVDAQKVSFSLNDAVAMASAQNPEIKSSQREIDKTQQRKVIARSLFLPTVNATAAVNHFFQLTPFLDWARLKIQTRFLMDAMAGLIR